MIATALGEFRRPEAVRVRSDVSDGCPADATAAPRGIAAFHDVSGDDSAAVVVGTLPGQGQRVALCASETEAGRCARDSCNGRTTTEL